jgi:NADH-quinone oxidoreductase subunit G
VAGALKAAKRPLIVAGASLHNADAIRAAANAARSLPGSALSYLVPECNSFGLALMAAAPLEEAIGRDARTAVVLENDLYRRLPSSTVDAFLEAREHVVVLDHMENRTTAKAQLLLPAANFAEADGTLISSEGRAQRFFRVFPPEEMVTPSWKWLGGWQTLDLLIADLSRAIPELAGIIQAAPSATFRMADAKIPREPHRYSGRTAELVNISVHEPKPPEDPDSPLSFSMEGNPDQPPAALIPFFWSPGWNSIQAVNKYQSEIAGPLRDGAAGVRLIEPARDGMAFFSSIPPAFQARNGEWLLVPLFHIFGSEEFSRFAPAVAEVCSQPYVGLNPDEAGAFGPEAELLGRRLPVKVASGLPKGVAGLPSGFPGLEGLELPVWSRITRV